MLLVCPCVPLPLLSHSVLVTDIRLLCFLSKPFGDKGFPLGLRLKMQAEILGGWQDAGSPSLAPEAALSLMAGSVVRIAKQYTAQAQLVMLDVQHERRTLASRAAQVSAKRL